MPTLARAARRLLIVAVLAIISLPLAAPVAAAEPEVVPEASRDGIGGWCVDWLPVETNWFTGTIYGPAVGSRGTKAKIGPVSGGGPMLVLCDRTPIDYTTNMSSAWVALEPLTGGTEGTIFQAGILKCSSTSYDSNDPCWQYGGQYLYFWAYGGCPIGDPALPTIRSLGVATEGPHSYSVKYLNGNFIAAGPWGTKTLAGTNPAVSCWRNSLKRSEWIGERFDGNDGFNVLWDLAGYIYGTGTTWSNSNWTPSHCVKEDNGSYCVRHEDEISPFYTY